MNEALTIYRGKDLVEKMNKVGLNIKLMRNDIASLCVSAALHIEAHKADGINVVNDLVEMTATVVHKNAVAVWLNKFAPVVWDSKAKKFSFSKTKLNAFVKAAEANGKTYEAELIEAPTYDVLTKPDAPFKALSVPALIKAAIARGESADDELAEANGKQHDRTGLAALRKLLAAIENGSYSEPEAPKAIEA